MDDKQRKQTAIDEMRRLERIIGATKRKLRQSENRGHNTDTLQKQLVSLQSRWAEWAKIAFEGDE